ncbi:MAG: hypothetical protein AAGA48_36495 [Myxococcota bacterium]
MFDIATLTTADRPTHLAFLYPPVLRSHAWFTADLPLHAQSRTSPGVPGVAPLVQAEAERGALVYDTGNAVPLAHLFERLSAQNGALGVRASLELVYLCADILVKADETLGPHGQVNPWTIAIGGGGRPVLMGHGVPSLEFDFDRPGSGFALREDSLRYAPPERFSADPIDLRSDLFALWLIGAEGILGKPLYEGVLDDLRHQAKRGDAWSRWYPHRERVTPELTEWMSLGLKPDWDARRFDPIDFVRELYSLVRGFDGDGVPLSDRVTAILGGEVSAGASSAIDALDPDSKWDKTSPQRTLYDPRTSATQMGGARPSPEDDITSVTGPRSMGDRDARRQALRDRLKSGPSGTSAMERPVVSSTTEIHGHTDYVTLDPLTEARPVGAIESPEDVNPSWQTTRIVERADPAPHAAPADLSWRVVNHGGRAVRVAVFDTDLVATVALRAAMEHGALTVDTSGRLLQGHVLTQGGRLLPSTAAVADLPPGELHLQAVPANLRLVTVQVETAPPLRFRSPTSLALPAAWFVTGIVQWLGLPEATWAAHVNGTPVDRDVLLGDVLGDGDTIVLAPLRVRPGH